MASESKSEAKKDEREKAIELALSGIEKQYGKGSIMRLGAAEKPPEVQVVPTGSLALDIALGVGGLPRGRVAEVVIYESRTLARGAEYRPLARVPLLG